MPKLTFVNIDDARWRRSGGDKIYIREGQAIVRKKTKPPPRKTAEGHTTRELMRTIAGDYKTLTPAQKADWDAYKVYNPKSWNAWNAMFTNNMRGVYPNVPCISNILNISSPATPPHDPTGFTACYYIGLDAICISWVDDFVFPTYIQAFEWIPPGRKRALANPWKYIATALSCVRKITLPTSRLVAGMYSRVYIRALNLRGEVSTLVQYLEPQTPAPPVAAFSGTPLSGTSPLSVQFTDLSTGLVFSRFWEFDDGGSSYDRDPLHIFTTAYDRAFSIRLRVTGAAASSARHFKPNYISVAPYAPTPPSGWLSLREHRNNEIGAYPASSILFTYESSRLSLEDFLACGYVFVVCEKAWLAAGTKKVRVYWDAVFGGSAYSRAELTIYDGTYDRTDNSDFPDTLAMATFGAGRLQRAYHQGDFGLRWDELTVDLSASTQDTVTIMVQIYGLHLETIWLYIYNLQVTDAANNVLKEFDLDPVTMEVTGTFGDYGYTGAGP